jgi:hypothetical protein
MAGFGEAMLETSALDAFELGTDLLTLDEKPAPAPISTRRQSATMREFLPRSGRRQIRETLVALIEYMTASMARDGLELVVDVESEQRQQELWRADDAAWFWLATAETNARALDSNEVLRMHAATIRRILDVDSSEHLARQTDLSRLPRDPAKNLAYEQWQRGRPKNDMVWVYIQENLPRAPRGAYVRDPQRLHMQLNSVTMYIYMVTMNPSAYGTHVRALMRGAFQYGIHHVLAFQGLGVSIDEYLDGYVERQHAPLLRDLLASDGVRDAAVALIEGDVRQSPSEYSALKRRLLDSMRGTRLVETLTGLLRRNTIDVDTRDAHFAYLFGLYKLLALLRAMCGWVAEKSHAPAQHAEVVTNFEAVNSALDRLDDDLNRQVAQVSMHHGLTNALGEASPRYSAKMRAELQALAEMLRSATSSWPPTQPEQIVWLDGLSHSGATYHARLLLHALFKRAMLMAHAMFVAGLAGAAKRTLAGVLTKTARQVVKSAYFAEQYQRHLRGFSRLKSSVHSVFEVAAAILDTPVPTADDVAQVLRSCVYLSYCADFARLCAGARNLGYEPQLPDPQIDPPTWNGAWQILYHWVLKATELASDPTSVLQQRPSVAFRLSAFGATSFGHESRTETTIEMLNVFFLTGLYRSLDEIDTRIQLVLFDLGRDNTGQLVDTAPEPNPLREQYSLKLSELRDELLLLLQLLRKDVLVGHSAAVFAKGHIRSKKEQATIVRHAAKGLIRILYRLLQRTEPGLIFSICSSSLYEGKGKRPQQIHPRGTTERHIRAMTQQSGGRAGMENEARKNLEHSHTVAQTLFEHIEKKRMALETPGRTYVPQPSRRGNWDAAFVPP